jgi:MFS transporter, DHA1 family, multidrug resistance protein
MPAHSQRNIAILAFTLVVVMLGYGIIMPILPFYVQRLGASGRDLGLLTAVSALMQLFFAPMWGSLSDRLGRKPVLLVGVFGYGLTMLLFGLSTQLWMLFAARTLNGILSSATLPTSLAYISDNTAAKDRGGGMGQLGAAMGIGVVLGPGLGGVLSTRSLATPFFVSAALCMVALLLVWLFLPESLPAAARQAPTKKNAIALREVGRALLGPLGVMLLVTFVVSFGMSSFQGILGFYALRKFGYGPEQVGTMWMVVGGVLILGQGALTGWLTKRLGDVIVIRLSLVTSALGYALILLATTYLTMLVTTGLFVLFIALLGPALNSLVAGHTPMKQGFTMGLSNSFTSLGRILGPVWSGSIFDVNINFPFLSGAVILLVAFLISLLWIRIESQPTALAPAKN